MWQSLCAAQLALVHRAQGDAQHLSSSMGAGCLRAGICPPSCLQKSAPCLAFGIFNSQSQHLLSQELLGHLVTITLYLKFWSFLRSVHLLSAAALYPILLRDTLTAGAVS